MTTEMADWQGLWRIFWLSDSGIKLYSISSVIFANKKGYYEILEQTTKLNNNPNFDFTPWIRWHLEAAKSTISSLKEKPNLRAKALKFYL